AGPLAATDDVRATRRGAAWPNRPRASLRADLPHVDGPADVAAAGARRLHHRVRLRRLPRPPLGSTRRGVDQPRQGGASWHPTRRASDLQDRSRRLTMFEQRDVERRGRTAREHRFALTFRTLTVLQMSRRLERAGFTTESVFG